MEAYGRLQLELGEEHAMRRMTEQQYVSLKKKAGRQVSGSFPFMNVLRSDISSGSLGSVARPPPSAKRGRREEGGSGSRPRDGDGGNAVLRGEERVSLRAILYFFLFSTLVLHLLYLTFLIYIELQF